MLVDGYGVSRAIGSKGIIISFAIYRCVENFEMWRDALQINLLRGVADLTRTRQRSDLLCSSNLMQGTYCEKLQKL